MAWGFAFQIDACFKGTTGTSDTFGNRPLLESGDHEFHVFDIEVRLVMQCILWHSQMEGRISSLHSFPVIFLELNMIEPFSQNQILPFFTQFHTLGLLFDSWD